MKNISKTLKKFFKTTKPLFNKNKEEIHKYNQSLIPVAILLTILVVLIPLVFSIFRESMRETIPAYLFTIGAMILLLLLNRIKVIKEKPLILIYVYGTFLYALVLYLSVFRFSDRYAATILNFFVIAPLLFVERSKRINIYLMFTYIIHTVLAFKLKHISVATTDLINTSASLSIGILAGRLFLMSRLNMFDIERLLTIEKETDFLTKLFNRRKLYDDFRNIDNKGKHNYGVLMMDIDHFKDYNDRHGHLNGDECLKEFGVFLAKTKKHYPVEFYRFGGEEFVGVTVDMTNEQLLEFGEYLRISTKKLDMPKEPITISVGIASCKGGCYLSIDHFLEKADKELYRAKNSGKDQVLFNFE